MRIVREDRLGEFVTKHADALEPVSAWTATVRRVHWQNLLEVRRTYAHADGVTVPSGKVVTIFNIKGNRYRLVTAIDYQLQVVNVILMLTHAEYGRNRWKKFL